MADTRKIMWKLQTALKQKGIIVTISTNQFFSDEQNRYINQYIAKRGKDVLKKSCSQIKIIECLKNILDETKVN